MKYLKIEDNRGSFLKIEEDKTEIWTDIDKIGKDDLLNLLKKAVSGDFEMDEFNEEILLNKTHQIIYKNLFEKFTDLLTKKTRFKDESETLYRVALEKYNTSEQKNDTAK